MSEHISKSYGKGYTRIEPEGERKTLSHLCTEMNIIGAREVCLLGWWFTPPEHGFSVPSSLAPYTE